MRLRYVNRTPATVMVELKTAVSSPLGTSVIFSTLNKSGDGGVEQAYARHFVWPGKKAPPTGLELLEGGDPATAGARGE